MMNFTLNKTIVKNFYRQNAGFFLFLFIVFFGVVAPSQQLGYHYALIRGMLAAPVFLLIVCFGWLLYAGKVVAFVSGLIYSPEYLFLYQLKGLSPGHCFRVLWRMQNLLFLPVSAYAVAIAGVAVHFSAWIVAVGVPGYILLINGLSAYLYYQRLEHPGAGVDGALRIGRSARIDGSARAGISQPVRRRQAPYWTLLLRYIYAENRGLWAAIKFFDCMILYLLLSRQTPQDYDLRLTYFFYALGLFGHGLLLFRCRRLETTRMLFYRGLPVSLGNRFGQYVVFCFLLLLPETVMLGWLTPSPIRFMDALELWLSGYSLLLLLSCCLFVLPLRAGTLLKLCLVLFGIWYGCVLGGFLIAMSGCFCAGAAVVFFQGYYRFGAG